jgi:hypothetical protein
VVALLTTNARHKPHAARIVFIRRIVESLRWGKAVKMFVALHGSCVSYNRSI